MFRWLAALLVLALLALGIMYIAAGRAAPPRLTIDKPDRVVGQTGSVDVTAEVPNGRLTALAITLEQNGRSVPLYTLDAQSPTTTVTKIDRDHVRIRGGPGVPKHLPRLGMRFDPGVAVMGRGLFREFLAHLRRKRNGPGNEK